MRVVQAACYFPPHIGGIENHVYDLSISLAKRGHDITVLTTNVPRSIKQERLEGNIQIQRFPAIPIPYAPVVPGLSRRISQFKADVYHSHCPPPFFSHAIRQSQHVVTYHADLEIPPKVGSAPMPHSLGRIIEAAHDRYFASKFVDQCDTVIATTHSYAQTSPVLCGKEYEVVPNAINLEDFDRINYDGERSDVLYVGRLSASKGGVDHLISAMKLVNNETEARLIIAGAGEDRPVLERHVRSLGLRDIVEFVGYVSHEEKVRLMKSAGVVVLPSVSRVEAFGIVLLEAMACRAPVIGSKKPGTMDVVEDAGLLVKPSDIGGLAESIVSILSDETGARRMGRRGREIVEEKYTWEHVSEQVEGIYERLV